jgi:hypothetical protein
MKMVERDTKQRHSLRFVDVVLFSFRYLFSISYFFLGFVRYKFSAVYKRQEAKMQASSSITAPSHMAWNGWPSVGNPSVRLIFVLFQRIAFGYFRKNLSLPSQFSG